MPTRRELLKVAGGLALVPMINMPVSAADKLPLDDPAAIALKYVEDAADATDKIDKMGVSGADQLCSNCRFYTAGEEGWGGCTLFQNRLVTEKGWCAGWIPTA